MLSTQVLFKLLCFLFLSAFASAQIRFDRDGDHIYWWEGPWRAPNSSPSPEAMRAAVKEAYDEMVTRNQQEAQRTQHSGLNIEYTVPSVMALVWSTAKKEGYFHSSVLGQSPTGRVLHNECLDRNHRNSGNCAEMWALTKVKDEGWPLDGGYIAVYGKKGNGAGFLSPCEAEGGKSGCENVLNDTPLHCVTSSAMRKRGLLARNMLEGRTQAHKAPAHGKQHPSQHGSGGAPGGGHCLNKPGVLMIGTSKATKDHKTPKGHETPKGHTTPKGHKTPNGDKTPKSHKATGGRPRRG